jgi:hypothetical protein
MHYLLHGYVNMSENNFVATVKSFQNSRENIEKEWSCGILSGYCQLHHHLSYFFGDTRSQVFNLSLYRETENAEERWVPYSCIIGELIIPCLTYATSTIKDYLLIGDFF